VAASVVEEHKVHHGVAVVVAFELFLELLLQLLHGFDVVLCEVVVERREAEQLRVFVVEVLRDARVLDVLLDHVGREFELLLDVVLGDETVSVDALALVHPELGDLVSIFVVVGFGVEDALEHACEVADVELLVEVGTGLLELVGDLLVQNESAFAEPLGLVSHVFVEVLEVVGDEGLVDANH